jgi:hypothetical protein
MSTKRKATMLRLTEDDIAIIQKLRLYYGVVSQNEVVRMALRAALRELPPTQAPDKDSAFLPTARSRGTPASEG